LSAHQPLSRHLKKHLLPQILAQDATHYLPILVIIGATHQAGAVRLKIPRQDQLVALAPN
jgi:hypothetical protein